MKPEEREALKRRWQEITNELEQIADLPEDDENYPEERESALMDELSEIELRLDPDSADRRRHEGRSAGD